MRDFCLNMLYNVIMEHGNKPAGHPQKGMVIDMTIKAIKEKYNGRYGENEKTMFTTFDYQDGNGKIVIVVTRHWLAGRTVWQAVRVSDGKELIPAGSCRPCDNLDDAIDVAGEMMVEAQ